MILGQNSTYVQQNGHHWNAPFILNTDHNGENLSFISHSYPKIPVGIYRVLDGHTVAEFLDNLSYIVLFLVPLVGMFTDNSLVPRPSTPPVFDRLHYLCIL